MVVPATRPVAVKLAVGLPGVTVTAAPKAGGEVGGEVTRGWALVVTFAFEINRAIVLPAGAGALRVMLIWAVSPTAIVVEGLACMPVMEEGAATSQNHISKSPPCLRSPLGRRIPTLRASPEGGWPNVSPSRNNVGSFFDQMKLPLRVKRDRIPRSVTAPSMTRLRKSWACGPGRHDIVLPLLVTVPARTSGK